MRPIKFRGKHINDESVFANEWVCGDLLHTADGVPHIHQIETDSYFEIYPETVGQFTGLLDKNGVAIYEGDIVMWGHANDYSREIPHRKAVVKLFPALHFETFTKTEFGTPHKFHYGNFSYKDTHKHLEVIGNIHDTERKNTGK